MRTRINNEVAEQMYNTDYVAMNYMELLESITKTENALAYQKSLLISKRQEEIQAQIAGLMKNYCVSKEEVISLLDQIAPEHSDENTAESTAELVEHNEVPALPETTNRTEVSENNEPIITESEDTGADNVFDLPEMQVKFNPLGKEPESITPEPEDTLPSFEEALADDPRYKVREEVPSIKQKHMLSFEECLSGEPINKILNMGYIFPEGSSHRYNGAVYDADGIIGTETAGGTTYVSVS